MTFEQSAEDIIFRMMDRFMEVFKLDSISYRYFADTDTLLYTVYFPVYTVKCKYKGYYESLAKGVRSECIFGMLQKQVSNNLYHLFCRDYYHEKPKKEVKDGKAKKF